MSELPHLSIPLVSDCMDRRFARLRPHQCVAEAMGLFLSEGVTGAAVVDADDNLVGVLSEKDCLRTLVDLAYHSRPAGVVSEYMSKVVDSVPSSTDLVVVAQLFSENEYRRLFVVDGGRLVGQVTRRDLLRAIHRMMRCPAPPGKSNVARPAGVPVSAFSN